MAVQVQTRRGTTAEHSSFTGANGEVTVDTDKEVVVVHDGATAGGYPLMRENGSNSALALGSAGTPSLKFTGDLNTGIYSPGADQVAISTGGSGRLFVGSAGDVGIGGSPSGSYKLEVKAGAIDSAALFDSTNAVGPHIRFSTSGTDRHYLGSAPGFTAGGTSSDFAIRTAGYFEILTGGNNPRLRVTSAGLVGIGTSSPVNALDVNGGIGVLYGDGLRIFRNQQTVNNTLLAHTFTGGNDQLNIAPGGNSATSAIAFQTATGSALGTRMFISPTGLVGIGTTSPGAPLSVNGNAIIGPESGTRLAVNLTENDKVELQIVDSTSTARALALTVGTTEAARIDSSGRLLVGTSTSRGNLFNTTGQDMRLQIEGTDYLTSGASFTSNSNSQSNCPHIAINRTRGTTIGSNTVVQSQDLLGIITFGGNDGSEFVEAARITAVVDGTPGANDMPGRLVFSTTADGASSPTERMRVNSVGAYKVTATGSYVASGNAHEFVANNNNVGVVEFYHAGNSTPYGLFQKFTAADPNNTSQYVFRAVQNTDTNIYTIWSNGTVSARSDARYKKNIETARNGYLEDLSQLRVVKYNWYNHEDDAPKELGFIAQEVEQVFPGLVMNEPEKDEEGNETGESCKSIKFSVFTPMLVKALQEANAKIEQLEARLSALESA